MTKRKRHSASERKEWVAKWRASGLPARRFAGQHGVRLENLYRWGREFPTEDERRASAGAFAEVRVRGEAVAQATVEIVLLNRRVVRLRGAVDANQLRELIEVLESC